MRESQQSKCARLSSLVGGALSGTTWSTAISGQTVIDQTILPTWLRDRLIQAGVKIPPNAVVTVLLMLQGLLLCAGFLVYGPAGMVVFLLPCGLLFVGLQRSTLWRAERFEQDYTAFLLTLSSSIRTGLDPLVAFSRCSSLFPDSSVVGGEIRRTMEQIDAGASEERAFSDFARSVVHPDIGLLRTALILSRRQGSSLGGCLHRLARVTRQRQSFRRKMRGAVAMQRLSAFGIAGCTVIVGVIQGTSNPQAIRLAWSHPIGSLALGGGIGLVMFGLLWMMQMSRRKL